MQYNISTFSAGFDWPKIEPKIIRSQKNYRVNNVPLTPKRWWKARHCKKNQKKKEYTLANILAEEIRREIDKEIIDMIIQEAKIIEEAKC